MNENIKAVASFRKQLYLDTADRLLNITDHNNQPAIKTIDLWNEQWQFLDKIPAFNFPAVFIGFKTMPWDTLGKKRQASDAIIEIHVGSYTLSQSKIGNTEAVERSLQHLELLDRIHYALEGWAGDASYFGSWNRISSDFDQNHNAVVAHVESYRVRVVDDSAVSHLRSIRKPGLGLGVNVVEI